MERDPASRTPRLIPLGNGFELRPALLEHAEVWYRVADRNRERLRRWLPWAARNFNFDDIRGFLATCEKDNASRSALTFGIWQEEAFCGGIGLQKIDFLNRSAGIGYWLDESHEGRGLMTQACRAVVSEAFLHYGLHRVELRCATGNIRSCAVPRRLGFSEEGVLRESERLCDHWADLRVFSILEQDWTAA